MKLRMGFVSNSSSSSFCIYGVALERGGGLDVEDLGEFCYKYNRENKIKIVAEYPDGFDYIYVGQSLSDMKDEETFLEFKKKTEKEVIKMLEAYNKDLKKQVQEEEEDMDEEDRNEEGYGQVNIKKLPEFDIHEEAYYS